MNENAPMQVGAAFVVLLLIRKRHRQFKCVTACPKSQKELTRKNLSTIARGMKVQMLDFGEIETIRV